MKKLLTVVFTMLLAGSLAFAQDTGGDKATKTGGTTKQDTGKKPGETPAIKTKTKTKSGKKGHKGGKKGKKSNPGAQTTPPPK